MEQKCTLTKLWKTLQNNSYVVDVAAVIRKKIKEKMVNNISDIDENYKTKARRSTNPSTRNTKKIKPRFAIIKLHQSINNQRKDTLYRK